MVYKRSLPPPTVRAIRKNQDIISKRNMAVDAGKSAYVRGKYNGLVEVPRGRGFIEQKDPGRNRTRDRDMLPRGSGKSRGEVERARAISTNQNIISSRNMAADAGRSTYVRGKNSGLVAVPRVMVRRSPADMDPGFSRRRRVPTPTPGKDGFPRPPRKRKPGDRRLNG
jgi:hypothetical protein